VGVSGGSREIRWDIYQEYPKGLNKAVDFLIETRAEREATPSEGMVRIEGGCYQMGSPSHEEGRDDDERQHRVCVEDFKIGKYEVTQAQWREVMGSNPSKFSGCSNCPVEQVSWNEVQEFLLKLNGQTGGGYRLPTEAEWEYACRGGRTGERFCGGGNANAVAWHGGNSGSKTHPVGHKQGNGYGLYDMSGNVWEWTCSEYDKDYGGAERRCISKNDANGRGLVIRGGSWISYPHGLRAAKRDGNRPDVRDNGLGFRLAQD
jgi:formylglycine-generating enzyme required for sulfatase activity